MKFQQKPLDFYPLYFYSQPGHILEPCGLQMDLDFLQLSRKKYSRNIAHHRSPLDRMNMEETQISGYLG